jgi:hypothetical protein
MVMRWLKCSARCAAAAFALLACSASASAQVLPPGYFFLEVLDEADKPVAGAATVVYDSSGNEMESSATNSSRTFLFRNRDAGERFVFRVIKPGYLTYEGTLVTSGLSRNEMISIKLIPSLGPKSKADAVRRAATLHAPTRARPSPSSNISRARSGTPRAQAYVASRGHPT